MRFWESQPRMQMPVSADGAAVVIVRFSDYQCPSCAQTYKDYKPILARFNAQYPGAIRVVQKDFPLETECNTGLARDIHLASCEAAAASKAAHAKGRGEAMDDWLYANHAILTPASVRQAAAEVGGVTDFDAQYQALINTVKGDIALATILGVKVTPTFFINGVKIEGGLPVPVLRAGAPAGAQEGRQDVNSRCEPSRPSSSPRTTPSGSGARARTARSTACRCRSKPTRSSAFSGRTGRARPPRSSC